MTTDILALVSMKNAAKCEKPCELHNTWIIKSLNASGAWEVASKHVCLRVVFIIANYFFFSFIPSLLWLIDWFGRENCLWFVSSDFIDWLIDWLKFRWDELRESSLFVCLFHSLCDLCDFDWFLNCTMKLQIEWMNESKERCLFISTTNQPTNEPNQFQLTLICDWLIDCWLHHQPSFFDWLIDVCDGLNEFESLIDWLIVVVNWEKLACFLLSILSSILSFILFTHPSFVLWPQIRQDYLLNLSI